VDETVRRHKPAPEAYQSVAAALEADPGDICLIASHVWDTLGAVAASWQAALILHAGKRPGLGGTVTTSENPAYSHDDDGYVLGHTSGEYQRQRWQARLWEDVTARLLEQVGARAGLRCLDVGCGSGEVMRLMAGLVAATGHTVPGRFAFVHADVETADAVPGGPFDLVFARFLLVFARDPAVLVRKLDAWTRPGGVLLMQEYDPRTFDIEPRLDTWDEFERVLYGSFRRAGAHPHVGRQLPHLFAAAGLGSPDGTDVAGLLTPLHDILPLYEAAYHSLRPAALRSGLTTEAAGEAFLAELAEAADRPDTTAMAPLVISAWKHKPSIPGT
jgi:SAM-dependent methyltransferase